MLPAIRHAARLKGAARFTQVAFRKLGTILAFRDRFVALNIVTSPLVTLRLLNLFREASVSLPMDRPNLAG